MGANGAVGRSVTLYDVFITPFSANFLTRVSSCSTFNYLGSHVNKLLSAFERGDLIQARAIQVLPMRLLLVASMSFPFEVFYSLNVQFQMQELLSFAMKLGEFCP